MTVFILCIFSEVLSIRQILFLTNDINFGLIRPYKII